MVNGIVYGQIVLAAVSVVLDEGDGDQSGDLSQLTQVPVGMFLLWIVATVCPTADQRYSNQTAGAVADRLWA